MAGDTLGKIAGDEPIATRMTAPDRETLIFYKVCIVLLGSPEITKEFIDNLGVAVYVCAV